MDEMTVTINMNVLSLAQLRSIYLGVCCCKETYETATSHGTRHISQPIRLHAPTAQDDMKISRVVREVLSRT